LEGVNSTSLPTISIALSGGGDRAALYGAGVLNALDGRNSTSVEKKTGGLLQAATYLSGLSGGSWLLSSFVYEDMPEICEFSLPLPRSLSAGPAPKLRRFSLQIFLTIFATDPMVLGDGTNSSKLGWHLSYDLFSPGTANQSAAYVKTLFGDVAQKKAAGNWNVTLNDVWARAASHSAHRRSSRHSS
jgi:lysophospholipase